MLAGHAAPRPVGRRWLDITLDHALLAGGMAWRHRDPFDRMLAAQCLVEGLALVTKDPIFGEVAGSARLVDGGRSSVRDATRHTVVCRNLG